MSISTLLASVLVVLAAVAVVRSRPGDDVRMESTPASVRVREFPRTLDRRAVHAEELGEPSRDSARRAVGGAALLAEVLEEYDDLLERHVELDCDEEPCIVAISATSGFLLSGEGLRAERYEAGEQWCGEFTPIAGETGVLVECYLPINADLAATTRTQRRVRELGHRVARERYPRDKPSGEACSADVECASTLCESRLLLPGCGSESCCGVRCIVGGSECVGDPGSQCVAFGDVRRTLGVNGPPVNSAADIADFGIDGLTIDLPGLRQLTGGTGSCILVDPIPAGDTMSGRGQPRSAPPM